MSVVAKPQYLFICGNAQCPENCSTGSLYRILALEVMVDPKTEIIIDASCTLVTDFAKSYIRSLLIGKNIRTQISTMIEHIEQSYHAVPQRAIISALKAAHKKYLNIVSANLT